jgi:hypothetical protein
VTSESRDCGQSDYFHCFHGVNTIRVQSHRAQDPSKSPLGGAPERDARVAHRLRLTDTAATATVAALKSAACHLSSEGTKTDSLNEASSVFGIVASGERAPARPGRADRSMSSLIRGRSVR